VFIVLWCVVVVVLVVLYVAVANLLHYYTFLHLFPDFIGGVPFTFTFIGSQYYCSLR